MVSKPTTSTYIWVVNNYTIHTYLPFLPTYWTNFHAPTNLPCILTVSSMSALCCKRILILRFSSVVGRYFLSFPQQFLPFHQMHYWNHSLSRYSNLVQCAPCSLGFRLWVVMLLCLPSFHYTRVCYWVDFSLRFQYFGIRGKKYFWTEFYVCNKLFSFNYFLSDF